MTAINHALTGAVIGLTVREPALALPSALISHFLLDSMPHFGFKNLNERGPRFIAVLASDIFLCGLLVMVLALSQVDDWALAAVCAFLATSPDFMWAPGFFSGRRGGKEDKLSNPIKRFHARIQTYQRPPGALVEITWAAIMGVTLVSLIKN